MKPLPFLLLLAAAAPLAAEDHPTPPAVETTAKSSLYLFDAAWTKQTGEEVQWKNSKGTARIVALGYATCKGVCPRLIGDMQRIEKELSADELKASRFTFITLDPAHDKAPEMKDLGKRHQLDPAQWDLLTGPEDAVLELAVALGIRYDRLPNGIDFSHSYLIAIIGPDGRLLHKWTDPSEGPKPSIQILKKALIK